ncbi:hypothetical protein L6164_002782 [Bauhinia variegata]|uniref:Uncharacterized protein n=1 Tax=Bauhinia variegata TaxID=167791 RepID=A0ACB9Q0S0_BAUVA|nr:hypothetical protein L6164_002782 [Bauhinia variegata]
MKGGRKKKLVLESPPNDAASGAAANGGNGGDRGLSDPLRQIVQTILLSAVGEENPMEQSEKEANCFSEIEAIRCKMGRKGQKQSLITSCCRNDRPETGNTWAPLENLSRVSDAIHSSDNNLNSGKQCKHKRKHVANSTQSNKRLQRSTTPYSLRRFTTNGTNDHQQSASPVDLGHAADLAALPQAENNDISSCGKGRQEQKHVVCSTQPKKRLESSTSPYSLRRFTTGGTDNHQQSASHVDLGHAADLAALPQAIPFCREGENNHNVSSFGKGKQLKRKIYSTEPKGRLQHFTIPYSLRRFTSNGTDNCHQSASAVDLGHAADFTGLPQAVLFTGDGENTGDVRCCWKGKQAMENGTTSAPKQIADRREENDCNPKRCKLKATSRMVANGIRKRTLRKKRFFGKKTNSAPLGTKDRSSRQVPATLINPVNEPLSQQSTQPPPESDYDNEESEETETLVPPAQPTRHKKAWLVDVVDNHGIKKEKQLTVHDVRLLPSGERIVLHWNSNGQPVEDSAGLLNRFLGTIARNFNLFPISYSSWKKVPHDYKDNVYKNTIQAKFVVEADVHKSYILKSIGSKWKDYRQELWQKRDDGKLNRDQLIEMVPEGINRDHWISFVDYRLNPKTKQNAQKNRNNRKKQTIPHTCGSKSLARKKAEMELERGRQVSRGEVWTATHKRANGTFVNDEAKEICEKIQAYESNTISLSHDISTQDSLAQALGNQEHSGRVRGLGLGPCPTHSYRVYSGIPSSYKELENQVTALKSQLDEHNKKFDAMMSFFIHNFQGHLPANFSMFLTSSVLDRNRHPASVADCSPKNSKDEE